MPRLPRPWKDAGQPQHGEQPQQAPGEPPSATASGADQATTVLEPGGDAPAAQEPVAGSEATVDSAAVAATEAQAASGASAAPVGEATEQAPPDATPRFRERSRVRRRLRHLRRHRELAFRDLGGLVFDLHRFGRERGDLVAGKLEALGRIDAELRALEDVLGARREVTDLREPGIAACPRCQTLHDSDANFCPGCGTPLRGSVVREAAPVSVTPATS